VCSEVFRKRSSLIHLFTLRYISLFRKAKSRAISNPSEKRFLFTENCVDTILCISMTIETLYKLLQNDLRAHEKKNVGPTLLLLLLPQTLAFSPKLTFVGTHVNGSLLDQVLTDPNFRHSCICICIHFCTAYFQLHELLCCKWA
jgi:hypothetical protein